MKKILFITLIFVSAQASALNINRMAPASTDCELRQYFVTVNNSHWKMYQELSGKVYAVRYNSKTNKYYRFYPTNSELSGNIVNY